MCGKNPIETVDDDFKPENLEGEELEALLDVMREYGKYTGAALVSMTHKKGTPWSDALNSECSVISKDVICEYFNKHQIRRFNDVSEIVDMLPKEWYDSSEDSEWEAYLN